MSITLTLTRIGELTGGSSSVSFRMPRPTLVAIAWSWEVHCEDESCKISLVLATDIVDLIDVDKFVGERVEDILGEFEGLYIENIKELPEDEYLAMYREKELELVNEYIGFFIFLRLIQ